VLLSMTGFGDARVQTPQVAVSIVARSVNNRHLKVVVRGTEPYPLMEAEFEKVARKTLKRGSLHITIRVDRQIEANDQRLNTGALKNYLNQLRDELPEVRGVTDIGPIVAGLLAYPGIAPENSTLSTAPEGEWEIIERALHEALRKLNAARKIEGQAMNDELLTLHAHIHSQLSQIGPLTPGVVANYRQRIVERVRQAVASVGVTLEPDQLIREIAVYADRTDVSEEMTRLEAHLVQFQDVIRTESDAPGRRLEFVIQEMGREANTLGSKAGDVAISRHVVEIKATLEKMKELVQNIE
jgi:uncharacterized protein (TIGR00255 family)